MPFFDHSLCDRRAGGFESHALGPKKKGPHCWEPIKSVVGDEGCRVRLRRPLPLRACGPRVLRWKTLTRFLSSAPLRVRIPLRWAQKRKAPIAGSLSNQWWAMRDVACGFAARFRFGPAALACCAGKRLRVSSAPHPCGFESLCDGPEKGKAPIAGSLSNRWWAMRDSNPQPCACKAPALTVAPIARAERV